MAERILFLCTGNSARSQMAEGLLRILGGSSFEVYSAGTSPSVVHPLAVQVMAEEGIDIGHHASTHVDEYRQQSFDEVITVCDAAAETCPVFPGGAKRTHWSLPDPAVAAGDLDEQIDRFRRVRVTLRERLGSWLAARA